ncbi:MAG TPA: hypothetical protein VNK44_02035 [Candidatus Nitrosotenuis sp.]|nr:hypothetical protein [Candidatus Nitrosotenuis sp.]
MKAIFALAVLVMVTPAFAQLSDRTGLRTTFDLEVDGKIFVIDTVANFDIRDARLENGKIVLPLQSSIENNFGELQIPKNVTSGQLRVYLDGNQINAKILQNERISFITLSFNGTGPHTLEVVGDDIPVNQQVEEVFRYPKGHEDTNQVMTIIAVAAVVILAGAASTLAFYFKKKKH